MISTISPEHVDTMRSWYHSPKKFCTEALKVEPDAWQDDPLDAVVESNRIALLGSKGVGKSFIKACIGWWWMVTRKQAQVICTSKNADNLRDGLWKEIGELYEKTPFLRRFFNFNTERISAKENTVSWFMVARGWPKHANPIEQAQALAGKHGPAMLWLGDEAGSYGEAIVTSGSAMLANVNPDSGHEGKIVLGGNTTDPAGPLGKIAKNRVMWHVVTINGDPDNPKRAKRVSLEWARNEIKTHGRNNPWVKVSVFAEFPDVGFSNLLGPDDIDRAKLRNYIPEQYMHAQKRLGVDVARYGDDATVIYCRQGLHAGPYLELRKLDTQQVADRVAMAMMRTKAEICFVDQTGVGAGVVDALRRLRVRVIAVDSSESPTDPRYWNKRAEMQCLMAKWVREGGQIPAGDTCLHDDLMAPTYTFKDSKTLIEPKAEIKKRLGRSPDWGDALALTFAMVDMPAADPLGLGQGGFNPLQGTQDARRNSDFDPHDIGGRSVADFDPFGERKM